MRLPGGSRSLNKVQLKCPDPKDSKNVAHPCPYPKKCLLSQAQTYDYLPPGTLNVF